MQHTTKVVPKLIEHAFISPAYERQFKNQFLGELDSQLLQLSIELQQVTAPIVSGCCETDFVFCTFFSPSKALRLTIKQGYILELIQKTANSVRKTQRNSKYENAMEIRIYLSHLQKTILSYTNEKGNVAEVDSQFINLKNFGEINISQFIKGTQDFCNAILNTYDNKTESDQFFLREKNSSLKRENVKFQKENSKLKQKITKLKKSIDDQSQEINNLKKTIGSQSKKIKDLIRHLKQIKNTGKQYLFNNTTIKNLKEENRELEKEKMNYKSSIEKLKSKLQNQHESYSKLQKLCPNMFITDQQSLSIKRETKNIKQVNYHRSPHPAISFFRGAAKRSNNTDVKNNPDQTNNANFLVKK